MSSGMSFSERPAARPFTAARVCLWLTAGAFLLLAAGCAGKPKPPATGPLRIQAQLVKPDGSAASTANLHLLTVTRDAKGELTGVTEHFGQVKISENPATVGSITLEIPRDMVSTGGEFSLALNPPGGVPSPLRQGGAFLTFTVDAATEELDLGKIVVQ
jgi:hypothetical protein